MVDVSANLPTQGPSNFEVEFRHHDDEMLFFLQNRDRVMCLLTHNTQAVLPSRNL